MKLSARCDGDTISRSLMPPTLWGIENLRKYMGEEGVVGVRQGL